jgi:hypothetical protein
MKNDLLTPTERLAIYEQAKIEYLKDTDEGLCFAMCNAANHVLWEKSLEIWNDNDIRHLLPEFWRQRPMFKICFWWELDDVKSRLNCLKKCIEDVEEIISREKKQNEQ